MEKEAYNALLLIKLQDFLSFIKDNNSNFRDSICRLYKSKVFEMLKNEELKIWQLSTPLLYEMLEKEKDDYIK
jgi:hypothetical protein